MFTKIYWIHPFGSSARLGIMARPRGNDSLDAEIANLKKQNVDLVVSLLEKEEIFELGLQSQEAICTTNSIEFINFPILDRGIPKPGDKVDGLIDSLITELSEGRSVVIHCRMGIGRSSIIAAAILVRAGLKADSIIENVCTIRGLKVPDTDKQLDWLKARR